MRIAFLNLCHTDPAIVERVANKLTKDPDFDMYIHVDAKSDIAPFEERLKDNSQVHFLKNRYKVYWGGYNAILATSGVENLIKYYSFYQSPFIEYEGITSKGELYEKDKNCSDWS